MTGLGEGMGKMGGKLQQKQHKLTSKTATIATTTTAREKPRTTRIHAKTTVTTRSFHPDWISVRERCFRIPMGIMAIILTIPILRAIVSTVKEAGDETGVEHTLVCGIDANVYANSSPAFKPGKQQGCAEFYAQNVWQYCLARQRVLHIN